MPVRRSRLRCRGPVRAGLLALALVAFGVAPDAFADDSYLLALTWLPTFCAGGTHAGLPECELEANGTDQPLALHGLWPDWDINGDGRRDAADDFCVAGDERRSILAADAGAAKAGNWLGLPAVQLSDAHSVPLAYLWQLPAPSQVPSVPQEDAS